MRVLLGVAVSAMIGFALGQWLVSRPARGCGQGEPPYITRGGQNVTGQTFYFAYDPSKGTLGEYRDALDIDATGAIDKDTRHYYEAGQWKIEYPDDTTSQTWTTDYTAVTAPGQYTATSHWSDDADLPEGEKPSRDDSPDSAYDASVTILVVQATLVRPSEDWLDSAPYRFDPQGVTTSQTTGTYTLTLLGQLTPQHARLRLHWVLSGGGTLAPDTIYSSAPTHIPPSSAGSGTLGLHVEFQDSLGQWGDTEISQQRGVEIFNRHLDRDIANEAALDAHLTTANCTFAAYHAYAGSANNGGPSCPYQGKAQKVFNFTDEDMNEIDEIAAQLDLCAERGKVVLYSGLSHIETLTGTTEATWGANTAADPGNGHWSNSGIGIYLSVHVPGSAGPPSPCNLVEVYNYE